MGLEFPPQRGEGAGDFEDNIEVPVLTLGSEHYGLKIQG